ncbi:hypothetical protein QVD17_06566 [Tagetes erecta]|uniref:Uncharacterized protein n=1 Tax=Tagetes erecta TaxID=13708 RepID=A0AAD8LDW9_TARER|nr:hypothetical protein QVD17_06566 [Tagetes erecta]
MYHRPDFNNNPSDLMKNLADIAAITIIVPIFTQTGHQLHHYHHPPPIKTQSQTALSQSTKKQTESMKTKTAHATKTTHDGESETVVKLGSPSSVNSPYYL